MADGANALATIANRVLPPALYECILEIFQQGIEGTALVGGTALAGYYAAHRRSDDIDLFSASPEAFRAAVLAVRHLKKKGVLFSNSSHSAQYSHANCEYSGHSFTVDVVLDENLFRVGKFEIPKDGVLVASLDTLLQMKIAALVSRASEKDLYDVKWLFERFPPSSTTEWIELGKSIDSGVNGENLLAAIAGSTLRLEACDFSLKKTITKETIFKEIKTFQKHLVIEIDAYLRALPPPPLAKLVKKLR